MQTTSPKAIRLLASGAVQPVGAAAAYRVAGDHGSYLVVIGDGFAFCSCPAVDECSHVKAATILQDALVDGVAATVRRYAATG